MNIDDAIHYGYLVAAAYGIATSDLKQRAGEYIKKEFDTFNRTYKVISDWRQIKLRVNDN